MVVFKETKPPTSLSDIEKIEKLVELKFPVEYKLHLLSNNGGWCEPNIFEFFENGARTNSGLDWFLAVYDGEYNNLKSYIEWYKIDEKRLPLPIIPIAHDSLGNLICISCGVKDNGYVYFWDHENEVDYAVANDEDHSNIYLIEKGFSEFMNSLK